MKRSTYIVFWSTLILFSSVIQYFTGNFPYSVFSFPLNLIIGALWIYLIYLSLGSYSDRPAVRFMLSGSTTFFSLLFLILGSLVIGLFPQMTAADAQAMPGILSRLGVYNFMSSWIFVAILTVFLTHLGMITLRGTMRRATFRLRFFLNHAGLWIAVFATFLGSADTVTLRIPVFFDRPNREAYTLEGERTFLGYNLLLKDFHAEYYENGAPRNYLAVVSLSEPGSDTAEEFILRVNHPYSHTFGQDIYLTSYDTTSARPRYCILQIVIQPWKYIQLLGIIMTLAGGIMLFAFGPRSGKKQLTQTT